MTNHTFLLARFQGIQEIDACATMILSSEEPDISAVWKQFRQAVTEWIKTPAGDNCWKDSVENLNVGDLLNHDAFDNSEFLAILRTHGIRGSAMSLEPDEFKSFDEVLVDEFDENEDIE